VLNSRINGDLQFFSNEARMVTRGNTIWANFQANQNTGGLVIENNTISENLQCQANNTHPTGGSNTAGDKEDLPFEGGMPRWGRLQDHRVRLLCSRARRIGSEGRGSQALCMGQEDRSRPRYVIRSPENRVTCKISVETNG
jgi:hypothetical protein